MTAIPLPSAAVSRTALRAERAALVAADRAVLADLARTTFPPLNVRMLLWTRWLLRPLGIRSGAVAALVLWAALTLYGAAMFAMTYVLLAGPVHRLLGWAI